MGKLVRAALGAAALGLVVGAATAQTAGQVAGTIDGKPLSLPVTCSWANETTLEIKSHDFLTLSSRFEESPALHMSFYQMGSNKAYYLVINIDGESYKMTGIGADDKLLPTENYYHAGTIVRQSGTGRYDYELQVDCPK